MKLSVVLCGVVLGACASEPVGVVFSVDEDLYNPGETDQGIYMLGGVADDLGLADRAHYLRVNPTPVVTLPFKFLSYTVDVTPAAQGANLVATSSTGKPTHSGGESWFDGMIFNDVENNYQLKLESGATAQGLSTAYHVMSNRRTATGWEGWQEYCGTGDVLAMPVRGWYDRTRIHHNDNTITFACLDAIGGKCPLWGYVSGTDGPAPMHDDTPWNLNQACTLMGNARYCPRGGPHTREGTPIQYGNFSGVPYSVPVYPLPSPLPGDPDAFTFEAGWSINGPVCLSKLRWRSLPANPCTADLPDPRTVEGRNAGGKFCDELTYDRIREKGALLINGSKVMDAPMQSWRSPWSPADQVLSMRGYLASEDPSLIEIVSPVFLPIAPPPPAPQPPANSYTAATLGADHMILRNLPSSLPESSMVKLYRWYEPGTRDRVVLDAAPPVPGGMTYSSEDFEGWAFKDRIAPTMSELRRCGAAGSYTTTIGTCPGGGAGVPLGYYVLPPP